MLAACGEEVELTCVAAVAWRATLEADGRPAEPPTKLLAALRRSRDRVNLRLTRSLGRTMATSHPPSATQIADWMAKLRLELPLMLLEILLEQLL